MSRIDRRNWTYKDIGFKSYGEGFDLLDNYEKIFLRLNDKELDHFLESVQKNPEEEELLGKTQLFEGIMTFGEKRQLINLLRKYINYEN